MYEAKERVRMSSDEGAGLIGYDFNGTFQLRYQKGLSPLTHNKLEHWRREASAPGLTIRRGKEGDLGIDPWSALSHLREGGTHVAIGDRLIADEVIVEEGRYKLVDGPSVYTISPGLVECSGKVSDSYFEHEVLRPVINNAIVPQGRFLAHAGGAALEDHVLVFIGETGKTSTLLELMTRGAEYLANESLFLGKGGETTLYSTWLGLEERHFELFPELNAAMFSKPSERRRQEKRLSFHQMGTKMIGGGFISRSMREFMMSRFQFSLLCSFQKLFPQTGLREHGRASHVFLLNAGRADQGVKRSDPAEIAKIAAASSWITASNTHCALAELAGMDTYTKQDLDDVLVNALSGAECYRVDVGLRALRTRKSLKETVDAMVAVIK
jgi:hypothetical protein